MSPGRQLARWLDELGRVSEETGKLTRTFLSGAMAMANRRVGGWMREAGLQVREDRTGNLVGRVEGSRPNGRTLLLGSHLDTVRDGGRFDGALGVLLPIVALRELRRRGVTLPFPIEVLGFSEEEGVRFGSAYLGSKAYVGGLREDDLRLRDARGVSVRDALRHYNRGTYSRPKPAHRRRDLLGYLEVHIEQGPVLEAENLSVGVVTAIAGQTRGKMRFLGQAGHAGTTPMALRQDALAGAAEFIQFAESRARSRAPLVTTVGTISVMPGAPNVIPGEAVFSIDVRHPQDAARHAALRQLLGRARGIARRRGLRFRWDCTQDNGAVNCSPALTAMLEQSVKAVQNRSLRLVSGAGHDAVVLSRLTPIAMLFVRCRKGLSHHPDEFTSSADLDVAVKVTMDFLQRIATNMGRPSERRARTRDPGDREIAVSTERRSR